ncbi:MAG: S9 family peptidase [Pseudomonadota bacterium]
MRRLTLLFVTLLFVPGALVAAPPALSLEEIVGLERVTAVQMSPAGDRIAYLKSVPRTVYVEADGPAHVELHVVDFEGLSRPYVTGPLAISAFAWSADGEHIFFVAKRDPEAPFNALHRIAVAGGEAEQVYGHSSDIASIHPSPDGKTLAFVATDAPPAKTTELAEKGFRALVYEESLQESHVWLLDLDSGVAARHDLPGNASTFAWNADGSVYAVALAPTPLVDDVFTSRDIHIVDAASGKLQNAIGSVGKLGAFAFSPDGERMAYVGSVDIHDPKDGRLYLSSADGGERRELVPGYMGHINGFLWVDDRRIRWHGHRGAWSEVELLDTAATREAGPAPDSGPIVRALHAHPGQAVAAALADSPEHPPEVYLLEEGKAPKRLTDSNPLLAERAGARQEVISYRARDGLELEAIVVHPAKKSRSGNPAIFVIHGGPEAHISNGWSSAYSRPAHALAEDGYLLAYPNYRGSTGRGVEFSKLGQNDYAEEEFNDIVDLKRHLVDEGLIDGDRVGITGGSYGGYATMWSASALTEEYAAAVAFVGISNQISKFGTGDIPLEMYNVHARTWPWDDWMWMLRRSPVYHAGKTKTPLLIMHGDADPRVHPAQSLEMYRFVKLQTETPVRLVFYPDEGHGNRNTAAQYDYGLRFVRWMDHYLKGPGGEPPPYELDHAGRLAEASAEAVGD